MNENENATQNLWDTVKAVLRGRFIALKAYLKKQEKSQINDLTLHITQLENERVTGRKARGLQVEKEGCRCQTFLSLLSGRKKQTSDMFSSVYKFKRRFLSTCCVAMTPGLT